MNIDLTVIILVYNEAENLKLLLPAIKKTLASLNLAYEILVLDGNSTDSTAEIAASFGCRARRQEGHGYGNAFKQALAEANSTYAITLDGDCSHDPKFITDLWHKREGYDLLVASRYVRGGKAEMPLARMILSVILNNVYKVILSLPYKDLSSGFRLYNVEHVKKFISNIAAKDFDVLLEVLIRLHCEGDSIAEIPFHYKPREHGRSTAKIFKFGVSYLKTLYRMWQIRNSAFSADYDDRAFDSIIPLQRYWQRKRYAIIMDMIKDAAFCADLGCGSSRIIQNLPHAVGLDIDLKKLRFIQRKKGGLTIVKGSITNLPFKDGAFSGVICSQVIEHIPKASFNIKEFWRVLQDGGILVIGTPDYGGISWRIFEWFYKKILPFAYGESHIAHYDRKELEDLLLANNFRILYHKYILGGELIIKAEKIKAAS